MPDQAAALRQLKKLVETQNDTPNLTPETYLPTIVRPCRFTSILLLTLDHLSAAIPPLQGWLPNLLDADKRACVWDQGGLFSTGTFFEETADQEFPGVQHIETASKPILGFPSIPSLANVLNDSATNKIKFVKNLDRLIGSSVELWITLPFSALPSSQALCQSVDLLCILVPNHPEAIIRSYEVVKSFHLNGFFSPISILVEPSETPESVHQIFERVNSVAKKFLSLDLEYAGMIISSDTHPETPTEFPIRALIQSIRPPSKDFLYSFAERLFYPAPGDRVENR